MRKVTVLNRQSLFDIAIQHCGAAHAAFDIAKANNLILADYPAPGTELIVPNIVDAFAVNHYKRNGIAPATSHSPLVELGSVKLGLLYNWDAASSPLLISNSPYNTFGWRLPTLSDWQYLISYLGGRDLAGGYLKDLNFAEYSWLEPNAAFNSFYGFNARAAGIRTELPQADFAFTHQLAMFWTQNEDSEISAWACSIDNATTQINENYVDKRVGASIRLVRDVQTKYPHEGPVTETYRGNDGRIYPVTKIGGKMWVAANIAETKFSNGQWIEGYNNGIYQEKTKNQWLALNGPGLCAYANLIESI